MTTTKDNILKINPILFLAAAIVALMATSCVTPAKVNYLQDMFQGSQIELENKFEAVVSPYDELSIIVSCADPDMAKPFNSIYNNATTNNIGTQSHGYLVDVNGNIQFPVLGELHVAGLTRLQLQDTIARMLERGGYIRDPYVMVRFANFKIFFLGADGGKAINISNERCTFLEALALSGDLNLFTNRSKIAVLREVNGRMTMRYLDPRSSRVFNDPYFMLQQNDFIITPSVNNQTLRSEVSYWLGWVSMATSLASLVATLMLYNSVQ
ncbi:MAG: polysaccharide biosynthesis/export family protein [Bacteroidales bacterium]|nr:polysaccharide biosynthesis/export family protein [Bacteroidales bacterium]